VGPRAGLDPVRHTMVLTLLGLELRSVGRPVRRKPLYRPSYAGVEEYPLSSCLALKYAIVAVAATVSLSGP
jgi:hypothetical protein